MKESLTKKLMREFGVITGIIVMILFGVLLPWIFGFNYPKWPWFLGAALISAGLLFPLLLRPVYTAWMKFGHIIGWVNTRILLGMVFYLMFMPVAFMLRLLNKDPMNRGIEPERSSYRVISKKFDKESMGNPF